MFGVRGHVLDDLSESTTVLGRRAARLRKIIDGGVSVYAMVKSGGPDKKTINKVLAREPITDHSFNKLKKALELLGASVDDLL
jgi:hypothetical protein